MSESDDHLCPKCGMAVPGGNLHACTTIAKGCDHDFVFLREVDRRQFSSASVHMTGAVMDVFFCRRCLEKREVAQ